jgi:regulator of nucleoside diphosphate kinase
MDREFDDNGIIQQSGSGERDGTVVRFVPKSRRGGQGPTATDPRRGAPRIDGQGTGWDGDDDPGPTAA